MIFTEDDKNSIIEHGLTAEQVEEQLDNFRKGFSPLPIIKAASIGDGIIALSGKEIEKYIQYYDRNKGKKKIVKFVPASGAATRMFKELFEFVNEGKRGNGIDVLLKNLKSFAFYGELKQYLHPGDSDTNIICSIIRDGLEYGQLPKGLITFHKYGRSSRKAVEEHLVEGAMYASSNGISRIHFTVSPEHIKLFEELFEKKRKKYEKQFGIKYDISYSVQHPSTDMIAVDEANNPFRQKNGNILFRPAGHGALIRNLDAIDADIIFIKTVDNVTTDSLRDDTIRYKKALAGMMMKIQDKCFKMIKSARKNLCSIEEIATFIETELMIKLPKTYDMEYLMNILDRPIRICGMVKNEGEPGGGPFWAKNQDGTSSLQIAESSQIAKDKISLMKEATHFNPVDIICGTKRFDGSKYNLNEYIDQSTGFISSKTSDGKALKAQERPGLWNGAMSRWNTIFVDVPITTFSPVKVVQDLLRKEHLQ